MEEKEINKELKDKDSKYILPVIISKELESKIRFLCGKFPTKEWSGLLFYKANGDLDKKTAKIECKDLLLMDIGDATFTSFIESRAITKYMIDNPEVMDYNIGLIH